ncbi:hypothetical protein FA15DRAFT_660589 [Coprinopsis marcescibilis]|uniref:Uncharacterized protein n=1 Tax=Coprinopsis marcescibilis TaxID=230819 RepID=A0A5C3KEK5_COPMA|nr:hypothetical protein FA15DRAFT_660589 [Coprinopsis marcescibilis]
MLGEWGEMLGHGWILHMVVNISLMDTSENIVQSSMTLVRPSTCVEEWWSVVRSFWCLLEPREITLFSVCNSTARSIVLDYVRRAWSVDTFLQLWFDKPRLFRYRLGLSGGVISGSQVLRFMDRELPYPGSDLDILVRIGGAVELHECLVLFGYKRRGKRGDDDRDRYGCISRIFRKAAKAENRIKPEKNGILEVINYSKLRPNSVNQETLKVQMIVVAQPPIQHIMLTYHSRFDSTHHNSTCFRPPRFSIVKGLYATVQYQLSEKECQAG